MTGRNLRSALRAIHVVFAIMLGALVYSPLGENYLFSLFTLYLFAPLVGLTGLLMWQQGALMRRIKK